MTSIKTRQPVTSPVSVSSSVIARFPISVYRCTKSYTPSQNKLYDRKMKLHSIPLLAVIRWVNIPDVKTEDLHIVHAKHDEQQMRVALWICNSVAVYLWVSKRDPVFLFFILNLLLSQQTTLVV